MKSVTITRVEARDRRFPLREGAGSDAVHSGAEYAFAVTRLATDAGIEGSGITLTLGNGNRLVCDAIEQLGRALSGCEIEETMAGFGALTRRLADDPALRWLGPHKGVVHLALASLVNACFDLWAKTRGVPLWRLLLDLTPEQVVALLDLSYVEDELDAAGALAILREHLPTRAAREAVLRAGYPGYDTSVGWFQFEDERVRENARQALARGFRALKLKVGSKDESRDLRRAALLRDVAGAGCRLMFDVNQQWTLEQARRMCARLREVDPYWIEEPTHPDDVAAHALLAREIAPVKIALGEHVPNRVMFKNFVQAGAVHFAQPDCTRLAGVSEFLTVSLLARKRGLPVAPHVGDMGQIHQHLVLFNHVALGCEALFLEHIPHLREYFVHPASIEGGVYRTPMEPGLSCDLKEEPS
ncbi:MAG: mandelate racemase [Acidobacteria bacterium]|nr:mandelate racemase [Acidobacteriota bacterium]